MPDSRVDTQRAPALRRDERPLGEVVLELLWVAAHHGLRGHGARNSLPVDQRAECWRFVHRITSALGNPPAPMGPR